MTQRASIGLSRRTILRSGVIAGLAVASPLLQACAPTPPTPTTAPAKPAAPAPAAKPTSAPAAAAPAAAPTERTIKAHTRATKSQEFMPEYAVEFEKAHPGVKVVIETIPAAEYFVKMRAMGAANQVGDIIWGLIGGGAWLTFAAVGMVRPVDDLVKSEPAGFLDQWYPATHGVATLDGKLYGIPEMSSPGNALMAWNVTAFNELNIPAPKPDWSLQEQFLDAATKLTKRTGDRVERFGAVVDKPYLGLVPMLRRFGGELLNPDGTKTLLDSPENVKAVQFLYDLENKHKVAPTSQQIEENSQKMFIGGKVATMANTVTLTVATSRNTVAGKFEVNGALTPRGPKGPATMLAAHHFGISVKSKLVEDSWELMKLWCSHEPGVTKVLKNGASPGGRRDVYNDPRLQAFDPVYKLAAEAMENLMPHILPHNVRGTEMATVLNNQMDNVWLGKIGVEEGLKKAAAELQKVLDKPRP